MSSEIIPVSCDTEQTEIRNECDHQWVHKAGAGYRATPVAICVKCHAEKPYCAKCGVQLDDLG